MDIGSLNGYQDLEVWKRSMELTEEIYRLTEHLPKEESYGLTSQMRRAAISVPSNIAEGYSRLSPKEFIRFLTISLGSKSEIQTQILICIRLGYIEKAQTERALALTDEVGRMTYALIKSIEKSKYNNVQADH